MDDLKQRIFDKSNSMRVTKNISPFVYDTRLEQSAQNHADGLVAGKDRPHDKLQQRIQECGFPRSQDCLISRRSMMDSYSEGVVNLPKGMSVDEKSVEYLVSGGPRDGHWQDFFDPKINRVGIGLSNDPNARMNYVVLDYGRICHEEPKPAPEPNPEDFSSI